MKEINLLYLSQEDVKGLDAPWDKMIEAIEQVFIEHNEEKIEAPPKIGVHPKENAFIHEMPSYLSRLKLSGIKWVSGFPTNYEHDLPTITGILALNDVETGLPVAVMDARWITGIRTAIVSAVTAKYSANPKSKTLGIIGTGVQGIFHAIALKKVLPDLEEIKIYDIKSSSRTTFIETLSGVLDIKISEKDNYQDVVTDTDVVVTSTQRLEKPIIEYSWLKEGVLGIGLEAGRAWGDTILQMDKFITDDWQQTNEAMKKGGYPEGVKDIYTELGEIINNKKPGRLNNKEKIMAGNLGISAVDIVLGNLIYELALEKGVGIELPLMKETSLI